MGRENFHSTQIKKMGSQKSTLTKDRSSQSIDAIVQFLNNLLLSDIFLY